MVLDTKLFLAVLGRSLAILTSILILRALTMRLIPSELGKYAIITISTAFFSLLFVNPVASYVNRKLHAWRQGGILLKCLGVSGLYLVAVAAAGFLLLLPFTGYFDKQWGMPTWQVLLLISSGVVIVNANQTLVHFLNMLDYKREWIISSLGSLWLALLLSWFLSGNDPSAVSWILGQYLGMSVFILIAIVLFLRLMQRENTANPMSFKLNRSGALSVYMFSWPLAIATCLYWLQFQSYKLMLGELTTLDFLGLFTAAYSLSAGIMGAFEAILQTYLHPIFFSKVSQTRVDAKGAVSKDESDVWSLYASRVIPASFVALLFILVLSKPLIHLLLDSKYWAVQKLVLLAAIVEFSRVVGNVYEMAAHATMKTRVLIFPHFIGALSVLLLLPLLLWFYQENGLLAALVMANLIYLGSMHIIVTRHMQTKVSFGHFFSKNMFIFYLGVLLEIIASQYATGFTAKFVLLLGMSALCLFVVLNIIRGFR